MGWRLILYIMITHIIVSRVDGNGSIYTLAEKHKNLDDARKALKTYLAKNKNHLAKVMTKNSYNKAIKTDARMRNLGEKPI